MNRYPRTYERVKNLIVKNVNVSSKSVQRSRNDNGVKRNIIRNTIQCVF